MLRVRKDTGRTGVSPVFLIERHDGSGNKMLVTLILKLLGKIPYTLYTYHQEAVSQLLFCCSVQAQRDTESSIIYKVWIPAFAGMTNLMMISNIEKQSLD